MSSHNASASSRCPSNMRATNRRLKAIGRTVSRPPRVPPPPSALSERAKALRIPDVLCCACPEPHPLQLARVCGLLAERVHRAAHRGQCSGLALRTDQRLTAQDQVACQGRRVPGGRVRDRPSHLFEGSWLSQPTGVYRRGQGQHVGVACEGWIVRFELLSGAEQLPRRTPVTPERVRRPGSQPADERLLQRRQPFVACTVKEPSAPSGAPASSLASAAPTMSSARRGGSGESSAARSRNAAAAATPPLVRARWPTPRGRPTRSQTVARLRGRGAMPAGRGPGLHRSHRQGPHAPCVGLRGMRPGTRRSG